MIVVENLVTDTIKQDNCFIILQIVEDKYFTAKNNTVMKPAQITLDIFYARTTDKKNIVTIFGNRGNLLKMNKLDVIK